MTKKITIIIAAILLMASCSEKREVKVACIGDSITEGSGIHWQSKFSYPVQLDSILGPGFTVLNCGRSGATLLKDSYLPYWICNEFYNVFAFRPDIIVIKLGTNDSKPVCWNEENYGKDLQSLIDTLKTVLTHARIYMCFPVPSYSDAWGISDSVIVAGVIPSIQRIAKINNIPIIDLYKALSNHSELFPDGIHPNEAGAKLMAEVVAKVLKLKE